MENSLKRMLYLSEFDNKRDKKIINESIDVLMESKQTEAQAMKILSQRNVNADENANIQILNKLKPYDSSKNQILLPIMVNMLFDNNDSPERRVTEVGQLFRTVSQLIAAGKLGVPVMSNGGYVVNNKTFPDYLKFTEFIHGLEGMLGGHKDWAGKFEVIGEDKPIFDNNGIKIFEGNDVGKCIKYTMGGLTGKAYRFCIGQPANTMWQSYRDTKQSTFYYITDENREGDDPLHIVIYDNTIHGIELTDMGNNTGTIAEYGTDVEAYNEYLRSKGVPVEKLVNIEKSDDEKKEGAELGNDNPDLDWFKNLSYDYKSKYVGRGHLLSDEQFKYIWQFKNDDSGGINLLKQYLDTGQPIPEVQFKILTT